MSTEPICQACGMQYAEARDNCPVCEDERQYVPAAGQQWTNLAALRASGTYTPRVEEQGPGIVGVGSNPGFAIGERALLVQAESGNFLWDCAAYLDDALVERVRALGGITGIAISHPHYYTTMVEWAHAFDAPIYLHEGDQQWIEQARPVGETVVRHDPGRRSRPAADQPGRPLRRRHGPALAAWAKRAAARCCRATSCR